MISVPARHFHRRVPRIFTALLLSLAPAMAAPGPGLAAARPAFPSGDPVEVVKIVDGDTLDVLVGRRPLRVRFFGVDSPEKEQPYYRQARDFTADLAFRKMVRLLPHDWDTRYPSHPRLVAEVILPDGRNLNRELIRSGMAWAFRRYLKGEKGTEKDFLALESEAKAARRGLWADKSPVPPWEWRDERRSSPAR